MRNRLVALSVFLLLAVLVACSKSPTRSNKVEPPEMNLSSASNQNQDGAIDSATTSEAKRRPPTPSVDGATPGTYDSYPTGWKFPFYGSSKITVGYWGNVCGGGFNKYHTGNEQYAVDWSRLSGNADIGDLIPAPASGWATMYFNHPYLGNYVRVEAGNGYTYLIAHMNKVLLNYCGWIKRGQVIGTLGCTGACDGAHIHFVVYKNGVSVPQNGISNQWDLRLCGTYSSGQ